MNSSIKKLFIGLLFISYSLVFGQFNTLTRNELKPKESIAEIQNSRREMPVIEKEKSRKNILNKIFSTPSKSDLKREIDSLKTMMLQYNLLKDEAEKLSPKNRGDSLSQINKQMSVQQVSERRPINKFRFIKEEDFRSKISMPLDNRIVVTSPFGWRTHPIFRTSKMHNGTDLKANYENVYAVLDGFVIESGNSSGGGKYIKVRHSDSFVTSYLHLSEMYYEVGERVKAGFIIARSGNSGNSTGPHLHFAVQENGKYINPLRFLNDLINANNLISIHYETGKNNDSQ